MIERHPFQPFVPENSTILILGSFPGKQSTQNPRDDDWYYGSGRNQFWKIIGLVFNRDFNSKEKKQLFFTERKIAITDILESCERKEGKNSDKNLVNKSYNKDGISKILETNSIQKILFTSKWVYEEFILNFDKPKDVELVILPSPSPIFRKLSLLDKVNEYKNLLLKNDTR